MPVVEMQPTISDARHLEVYNLAFGLSLEIHKASLEFPKTEQFAMADQLRRASKSICANLAGRIRPPAIFKQEFKRFLMLAASSCAEVKVWLDYCIELKYITRSQYAGWSDQYDKVSRMLHKLRRKLIVDS
ncbi:MAG: four helix bundle protein [Alphaproteobacteria bacterium]